jgi:ferredoxin--NADP+ reductase
MATQLNATVTKVSQLNHGLLVIQIRPDDGVPDFTPGQYCVLGLPGTAPRVDYVEPEQPLKDPEKLIRRAYSITSSSKQGEYLEFYVALMYTGALTPRLFALQEEDRLFVGKKVTGMFTLADVPAGNDVIFVATGTGLAPYVSMLRSGYRFEDGHKTLVIHGARVSWDLGYMRDLIGLATRWPGFHYLPVIDEKDRDPDWTGKVGFVSQFFDDGTVERLLGHRWDPNKTSVFLCGNPLMIDMMEKKLTGDGFTLHTRKEPGNIFVEKF